MNTPQKLQFICIFIFIHILSSGVLMDNIYLYLYLYTQVFIWLSYGCEHIADRVRRELDRHIGCSDGVNANACAECVYICKCYNERERERERERDRERVMHLYLHISYNKPFEYSHIHTYKETRPPAKKHVHPANTLPAYRQDSLARQHQQRTTHCWT
jgi:hypothetical protein